MKMSITLNPQQQTLAIMRVENGWLVRTDYGPSNMGLETPMRVAETPETLVAIIREWAVARESPVTQ